jgi:GNAT superfamily N-acetyltransferase
MMKTSKIQTSQKQNQKSAKVKIRHAEKDDASVIANLSAQLGYPATEEQIQDRLAMINRSEKQCVFVAQLENGPVVGWVQVSVDEQIMEPVFVEVKGLVVDETARNQSIGAQLLDRAETWAKEKGFTKIRLRSNVIRKDAHRFYLNHGYSHIKSQHVFAKEINHA